LYLTFVAAGGNSEASVEMRYEDESIWLTQKMMSIQAKPWGTSDQVGSDTSGASNPAS
jgi:hypothetical protein